MSEWKRWFNIYKMLEMETALMTRNSRSATNLIRNKYVVNVSSYWHFPNTEAD